MLGSIATENIRSVVYRLASVAATREVLEAMWLGADSINTILDLCRQMGFRYDRDSLSDLCESPFKPKRYLHRIDRTRFSDGTVRVFYGSIEPETAQDEVRYWVLKTFQGSPNRPRILSYEQFVCTFEGNVKDLRAKHSDWPQLTHVSDYRFCNQLGLSAVRLGLDGFLTPSGRRSGGTNLPAYLIAAL